MKRKKYLILDDILFVVYLAVIYCIFEFVPEEQLSFNCVLLVSFGRVILTHILKLFVEGE